MGNAKVCENGLNLFLKLSSKTEKPIKNIISNLLSIDQFKEPIKLYVASLLDLFYANVNNLF